MDLREVLLQLSLLLFFAAYVAAEKRRLNDYIGHYEGLTYSTQRLHDNHVRSKRSTAQPPVQLRFSSHGRVFHLRLTRDVSTFVSNPEIEHADGSIGNLDISHIYEGELVDEAGSYVHGSIIGGRFAGKIYTKKHGNYYVDKAEVHFRTPQLFHSIVYHEDEVADEPKRSKRSPVEHPMCGSADPATKEWMKQMQHSAVEPEMPRHRRSPREASSPQHNKYSSYFNENVHRRKREVSPFRTCTLFMQSDTELWKYVKRLRSEGGLGIEDDERAHEEITSLFGAHVSGIKKIYENTNFRSGDLDYKGFTFVVRRVKINTTADCEGSKHSTNLFCKPNIDVSNFLNLNSLMNHDLFCLAYLFTYRDFTGGTLGLAWVGSPTKASGGICEKYKEYTENGRRIKKSLNTGVVTLVNYNSRVPPKVSTLTFAHEVGHNFGSPHDSGPDCVPTTEDPNHLDGNFIMFASATSGDRPNNSKFSSCSISNITLVVDAILNSANEKDKRNCFVESQAAFCGNAITETGEQCDCGFEEDCNKTDRCCFPNEHAQKCTLKPNVECSPSQGPCCDSDCKKVPGSTKSVCSTETECSEQSVCDGTEAKCPAPLAKANLTACNDYTQVCRSGDCVGSICEVNPGWEQCYITATDNDKSFDKGIMCYVACQNPDTGKCVSTGDDAALEKEENQALKKTLESFAKSNIKLMPGAPCDNFMGFCDVFQKCRGVDADGPLARLKNLVFNEETFKTIKDWIISYWWAVLLMILLLIILMGLFIHVCAVHTPSSNPSAPKARKLSLKPQRRQQGPPPAYIAGPSRSGPAPGRGRGGASGHPQPGGSNVSQPPPYSSYEMKGHQRRV